VNNLYCLEKRRANRGSSPPWPQGITSRLRGKSLPWGPTSPRGLHFPPRGEIKNWPTYKSLLLSIPSRSNRNMFVLSIGTIYKVFHGNMFVQRFPCKRVCPKSSMRTCLSKDFHANMFVQDFHARNFQRGRQYYIYTLIRLSAVPPHSISHFFWLRKNRSSRHPKYLAEVSNEQDPKYRVEFSNEQDPKYIIKFSNEQDSWLEFSNEQYPKYLVEFSNEQDPKYLIKFSNEQDSWLEFSNE
jgi:hypothetical protein